MYVTIVRCLAINTTSRHETIHPPISEWVFSFLPAIAWSILPIRLAHTLACGSIPITTCPWLDVLSRVTTSHLDPTCSDILIQPRFQKSHLRIIIRPQQY